MRKRERKEKKCKNCGNDIPNRNIYCNNTCQNEYQNKQIFLLLENEEFSKIGIKSTIDRVTKKYLIKKYGNKCSKCGWNKINKWTNRVPIEINHIDGNPENHKIENTELLCPNCHSLTEFTKSRGKGRKWRKTIFEK